MNLQDLYVEQGANLASDGIPLHFGSLEDEFQAALNSVVLFDRSHEGRILVTGKDRLDLLNRISTNELLSLQVGEGRATIFTNPTGRILERAMVYVLNESSVLLIAGPGRGTPLQNYLQRNIFFNDDVALADYSSGTHQFALHGPNADKVVEKLKIGNPDGITFIASMKSFHGGHWVVVVEKEHAVDVWRYICDVGRDYQLLTSGGLVYNTLRIYSGQSGVGHELTNEYIPLELGLWDEISFNKGCYTGQEIIARMESRNQLARVMVSLDLPEMIDAPEELSHNERSVGKITSTVLAPDGNVYAIGFVKTALAESGTALVATNGQVVTVKERLGEFPARS